jgi:hypothetical protein
MEEENEYIELPDDPEEAFAAVQRRKYKSLEQAWEDGRNGRGTLSASTLIRC